MKVLKMVVMVVDFDEIGAKSARLNLEEGRFANDCIMPQVMSVEERDIGEWDDSNPLNFLHTAKAEFERLFPVSPNEAAIRDILQISEDSLSAAGGRVQNALALITRFGGCDGAHHKDWVLDQVARVLLGGEATPNRGGFTKTPEYAAFVSRCEDEVGPGNWSEGIAP